MLGRALLVTAAAIVGLLLVEGVLSLAGRRSFGDRLHSRIDGPRTPWDEERFAAAARSPGAFRVHPDPFVGAVLKADCEFDILGGKGRSDALGLRMRPPSAPALPGAGIPVVRVAVLGDSVAFGFGLDDEQTLAARLEEHLNRSRGPASPRVVCRTVAMPGWNYRNEFHFLRDHFDELDPDVVVYLPISNDLAGTRGVQETGQRAPTHDLTEEDPWLVVSYDLMHLIRAQLAARARAGEVELTEEDLGVDVISADVSPASSRRYDAMAEAVLALEAFLEEQDCRLMVVRFDDSAPLAILLERLHRLGLSSPTVAFLRQLEAGDTLADGSHPTASVIDGLALQVARALFAHGLLERGEDRSLPPLPEALAERRAPPPTPEDCAATAAASRARSLAGLQEAIDWTTGRGVLQAFGDLTPPSWVGTRLLAVIRGGAGVVRIELEALEDRPDLYPLMVEVEIGGRRAGELRIEAGRRAEGRFVLGGRDPHPIEILLRPERWVVVRRQNRSVLASFRVLALEGLER